jgi:hypothetical protein
MTLCADREYKYRYQLVLEYQYEVGPDLGDHKVYDDGCGQLLPQPPVQVISHLLHTATTLLLIGSLQQNQWLTMM